jgi:predicted DNA-binding transcriptional regulator AlpA
MSIATRHSALLSPLRRCLDADQVAERYGVSRRQIFRLADGAKIPPGFLVGRLRRWDENAIAEHIAAGCPPVRERGAAMTQESARGSERRARQGGDS